MSIGTFKYVSSTGDEYNFIEDNHYIKTASLHDFTWEPNKTAYKYGDKLKGFTKDSIKYDITLGFYGSQSSIESTLNTIHDLFEHDVMLESPGKIYYGDYSIECYIISSKVYPSDEGTRTLNDITIYCPYPFWTKETTYTLTVSGTDGVIDGLDYPFDFPFDLGVSGYKKTIAYGISIPVDFKLKIYGPVTNPTIVINGHTYEVDVTVGSGSTLTIDSLEKTDKEKSIVLTYPSGTENNVFYARNRDSYIFQQITGPKIIVTCAQDITFDLTLIENRSEPLWS
jgi:hypothetical protein